MFEIFVNNKKENRESGLIVTRTNDAVLEIATLFKIKLLKSTNCDLNFGHCFEVRNFNCMPIKYLRNKSVWTKVHFFAVFRVSKYPKYKDFFSKKGRIKKP